MRKCRKCNGEAYLEYDHGWQEHCLQCGKIIPLAKDDPIILHLNPDKYSVEQPLSKDIGVHRLSNAYNHHSSMRNLNGY